MSSRSSVPKSVQDQNPLQVVAVVDLTTVVDWTSAVLHLTQIVLRQQTSVFSLYLCKFFWPVSTVHKD